jgi:hypothetical protein
MAIVRLLVSALAAALLAGCGAASPGGSAAAGSATASAGAAQPARAAPVTGFPAGLPAAGSPPPPANVLAHARQAAEPPNRVDGPVEWVRTTLGAAWRTDGSGGDGDPARPAYVIQLHGRFCCHPGPPGHDPTSTSVFEILPVDGRPSDSLGGGASTGHPLDLNRLGPVHTFTLH